MYNLKEIRPFTENSEKKTKNIVFYYAKYYHDGTSIFSEQYDYSFY